MCPKLLRPFSIRSAHSRMDLKSDGLHNISFIHSLVHSPSSSTTSSSRARPSSISHSDSHSAREASTPTHSQRLSPSFLTPTLPSPAMWTRKSFDDLTGHKFQTLRILDVLMQCVCVCVPKPELKLNSTKAIYSALTFSSNAQRY